MLSYIRIGQIINTHGHRGELKVFPLTDDISRYSDLEHVYIKRGDGYKSYEVSGIRFHQGLVLLSLREVLDMNEAEKYKGLYLELPENELRKLPEGHYYIFQLVGLKVYEQEKLLGEITDIFKTGSNDVYVVESKERKKPLLIPALKDVVKNIDIDKGFIKVELPMGLED